MVRAGVCGVYMLRDFGGSAVYIGSALDIDHRWSQHRAMLRAGRHPKPEIQAAWNRGALAFTVLERTYAEDLAEREGRWISRLERLGWRACNVVRRPVRCPTRTQRLANWLLGGQGLPWTNQAHVERPAAEPLGPLKWNSVGQKTCKRRAQP
jgi:hypothetical protein